MSELEERICQALKRRFRCVCSMRPPYCRVVAELFDLVLETCGEAGKSGVAT